MHFEPKDAITLAIAFLGAVLGIINTWNSINQRRVRLRVVPKLAYTSGAFGRGEGELACIEVTNLSSFPVPISEIGFSLTRSISTGRRLAIGDPLTTDHKPFPRTLQPHQSLTGYFSLKHLTPEIRKAYVRTDSDVVTYGTSPALKGLREKARG